METKKDKLLKMMRTEEKPFEEQLEDDEVKLSQDANSVVKASVESDSNLPINMEEKQFAMN